jgi:hypothetical protein
MLHVWRRIFTLVRHCAYVALYAALSPLSMSIFVGADCGFVMALTVSFLSGRG